jgi:hypothetical protein
METSEASFALRGDAPFAVHMTLQTLFAIRAAVSSENGSLKDFSQHKPLDMN